MVLITLILSTMDPAIKKNQIRIQPLKDDQDPIFYDCTTSKCEYLFSE